MIINGEEYLTEFDFRGDFIYPRGEGGGENKTFLRAIAEGLPRELINGEWMYPRERCHAFFRGEL